MTENRSINGSQLRHRGVGQFQTQAGMTVNVARFILESVKIPQEFCVREAKN